MIGFKRDTRQQAFGPNFKGVCKGLVGWSAPTSPAAIFENAHEASATDGGADVCSLHRLQLCFYQNEGFIEILSK